MTTTAESLQKALELHRGGQLADAERIYLQVLSAEPHHAQATHLLGVAAHQRGDHAQAVQSMQRAIQIDSTQVQFRMDLATVYVALRQPDQAVAAMQDAVRLQPGYAKGHNDLGVLLANLGRWEEAIACFRKVLEMQPDDAPAHNNIGNVRNQQGRHRDAAESFRAAIRLKPDLVQAYNNLANTIKTLGEADEAVRQYRRALDIAPDYVETHFNLAITLKEQGRMDESLAAYREALRIRPDFFQARYNLGNLFKTQGLLPEAREAFEVVIGQRPDFAEAHHQLGSVLRAQGDVPTAELSYRTAVRLKPSLFDAQLALANLLRDRGSLDAAISSYDDALRLQPNSLEAINNLSIAFRSAGRLEEAAQYCQRAIAIKPDLFEAHANLGLVRQDQQQFAAALASHYECLRLRPDLAAAHNGLGVTFTSLGRFEEAIAAFERALEINPSFAEAHGNIGRILGEHGKYAESLARIESAVLAQPGSIPARTARAFMRLLMGNFSEGWPEYEWRWKMAGVRQRPGGTPWEGEALDGRTILLYSEQGLGDTLQFIRYAPLVKQRGGRVIVDVPRRLMPLLSTCPGIDQLHGDDEPPLPYDVHAALLNLPGIFGTELATIPAKVPYLSAPEELVQRWQERLAGDDRLRVGIQWQGNPTVPYDAQRSIPLTQFAPLAEVAGVRMMSLQKNFGSEQLAAANWPLEDLASRLDEQGGAFCETAAVMKNLDLVITSDTSIAHLAGALGVPVWVALSTLPDWRWLLERQDSPWYPSMRLFRQARRGDWSEVFQRIKAELAARAARHAVERKAGRGS